MRLDNRFHPSTHSNETDITELEDLSDEDDDPEKITTTAFGRTNRPDVTGGKDKDKRKCSLKSLKVPILFRERAPSAPLITCSIGEIGPIAYLDAGVVEGLFAPEQRKQQRDRERKVTPISQPRRRSCGNFPVNMIYSSLLPKQTPVGSGKDVEVEIDMSKERDRIKGRMRGAGAFHSTPHSDRKAEEAVIISLTPSIQQLLQPSAGQDSILHVTPSKKDKESGSVMASTTGNAPTSTPRRLGLTD